MNVSMTSDNGANYFNIIAPGKENEAPDRSRGRIRVAARRRGRTQPS
jgi:hypothetical protein